MLVRFPAARRSTMTLLGLLSTFSLATGALPGCAADEDSHEIRHAEIALQVGSGTVTLDLGASVALAVAVSATAGRLYTLEYSSSNDGVVGVSPSGVLSGKTAGKATINVVARLVDSGATANASVVVTVAGSGTTAPPPATTSCAKTPLDLSSAASDGGFAWYVLRAFGTPADESAAPTRSLLRLFENDVELAPAHAVHADIRAQGRGRYSHWGSGTSESLRFSSSDNSDPRTNGRRYSTCISGTATAPTGTTTPTAPTTPTIAGVAYKGVSAAMWAEIDAQRVAFGDPNDCHARVDAVPTTGGVTLKPGDDINAALRANNVVFLSGGTYKPGRRIVVPVGKALIGVPGQTITIDASDDLWGVVVQSNATLANVIVSRSQADGITFYDDTIGIGSKNSLVYRVSARQSGLFYPTGDFGGGLRVTQNAVNNCVVSFEASESWNELGAPNDHGGNADGIANSFGAHHNTFIDAYAFNNGDDGFDMWQGGQTYWYFSTASDNGKVAGKTLAGNGNGIKLGIGSVAHKLYKTSAINNRECGYDLNGNTIVPIVVQPTSTGNPSGNYCGFTP